MSCSYLLCDRRSDHFGFFHDRQRNKVDSPRELIDDFAGYLDPKPGFADSAGSSKRDQSYGVALQELPKSVNLTVAPDQHVARHRQIAGTSLHVTHTRVGCSIVHGSQVASQIARRVVALFRVLGETPCHNPDERSRRLKHLGSDLLRLIAK